MKAHDELGAAGGTAKALYPISTEIRGLCDELDSRDALRDRAESRVR